MIPIRSSPVAVWQRVLQTIRLPLRAGSVALTIFALSSCGGSSGESAADSGKAQVEHSENETQEVQLDTMQIRLAAIVVSNAETVTGSGLAVTGTITYDANRVTHIGARTDGRVLALRADLGTRVRRGQVLVELESPEVGGLRADEQEARALVRIASENYARERRLEQQGISSRKELLEAERELRRAEASMRSARARLNVYGATHGTGGHFDLLAPFAGVVVGRDVSLGEMATPADTLLTIADLSRVWIELDVFERDLGRVNLGQPVSVSVTAAPERKFPGRIVYLGDVLDASRRTVRARVEIPNQNGFLRPGMFANASIDVGAGGPVSAAVPAAAVQEVEGEKVVFVPGAGTGQFRAVRIELGEQLDGGRVIIRSGLAPGARVVVAGAFALRSELSKGEIGEGGH